jgi:DnaJ-class molecular chaperone
VKGECPQLLNEDSGGDANLDIQIEATLAAYRAQREGEKEPRLCRVCFGFGKFGHGGTNVCSACNGSGTVTKGEAYPCPQCDGEGELKDGECPNCKGTGKGGA